MTTKRFSMFAAAVFGAAVMATPAVAAEMVFGSWPPAGDYMNRVALPRAFAAIAKESNNAVTWKLVPGGQLADPKSSFQAVQDGLIQGALGISTYVPNLVPSLNTIYSTVVFGDDTIGASAAAVETLTLNCPGCFDEFKRINAVPLGGWTSSPYYLACTTPIRTLADLKGKRVRATGGQTELMNMLGAVPISATLVEAVGLLQRGGLDCQFGVHFWLKIFGYGDFAKYIVDYPLGLTGPAVDIWNREALLKMTEAQRRTHVQQMGILSADMALGAFVKENEDTLNELKTTKGVQLIKPTDEANWAAVARKYDEVQRKTNIENAQKFGVKDPGAIIDAYARNREKWGKLSKEIGRDLGKYTDAIQREIYGKLDLSKL